MPSSVQLVLSLVSRVLSSFRRVLTFLVYFIYPETANIALEDMGKIFNDNTTAMPTPSGRSLLPGVSSPVPSMDLRRGYNGPPNGGLGSIGPNSAIPGLDIDPPQVTIKNGKPQYESSIAGSEAGEGVGGWISRMVNRTKDDGSVKSGKYKQLDQDDNDNV